MIVAQAKNYKYLRNFKFSTKCCHHRQDLGCLDCLVGMSNFDFVVWESHPLPNYGNIHIAYNFQILSLNILNFDFHRIKLYPDEELLEVYRQRIADQSAKKSEKSAKKVVADVETEKARNIAANRKKTIKIKDENALLFGQKRSADHIEQSLQDNPHLPKSVKSMFTTSEGAKKQQQGHWVTHNPLYY